MLEGHDQAPVLVTGATSQIGRRVLGRLSAADVSVAALSRRLPAEAGEENAQLIVGDLTQPALDIGQEFPSLVHIAGIWLLPPHISNLHRNGLRRLVCFSSTAIYNKLDSINASERDVARRMIAAEKSIAEQCDSMGIQWTILRPTLIYGLGLDRNVSRAAHFIRKMRVYPLATGATGLRQPVHADDLAAAAIAALQSDRAVGRSYDVGGGERLAYREMIGRIFDTLNLPRRLVPVPGLEFAVAAAGFCLRKPEVTGDVVRRMRLDLICGNDAAEADLDFQPRAFLSGGLDDLPR